MLQVNKPMVSLNEIARDNCAVSRTFINRGIRIKRQDYRNAKSRIQFNIASDVMQRCGFTVGDRVEVLFSGNGLPEVGLIQLNPEGYKLSCGKPEERKGKALATSVSFTLYEGMPLPNGNVHIELVTTEPGKCQFIFPPGSATIYKG